MKREKEISTLTIDRMLMSLVHNNLPQISGKNTSDATEK